MRIIVIRHAEKTGEAGDRGLSARGMLRARHLRSALPAYFGPIHAIIAARSTAKSTRPADTVAPLAKELGLPIDERWSTYQHVELAKTLLRGDVGSTVLVCWRHKTLQQLAKALGSEDAVPWPETVYERLWLLTILDGRTARQDFRTIFEDTGLLIYPDGTA